jgi:hypothetical protein
MRKFQGQQVDHKVKVNRFGEPNAFAQGWRTKCVRLICGRPGC